MAENGFTELFDLDDKVMPVRVKVDAESGLIVLPFDDVMAGLAACGIRIIGGTVRAAEEGDEESPFSPEERITLAKIEGALKGDAIREAMEYFGAAEMCAKVHL